MEDFKREDIKIEVFETEDVKIEDETIDEEDIKTENELTFGILYNHEILDFHNEDVIPEEKITEDGYYLEDDDEEGCEVLSSTEENYRIIEEVNTNCTRSCNARYLHPTMKEESKLIENPVNEVSCSNYGEEKFKLSGVGKSKESFESKNHKLSSYRKSGFEKQEPLELNGYEDSSNPTTNLVTAKQIPTVHLKVKPFKCTECSSSFANKYNLASHNRGVHLKEKPYKCSECTYSCFYKKDLTVHVRSVHLKEKPFRCPECEFAYSQKSALVRHIRSVHLRERPFKCAECESSFSEKSTLLEHIQSVHLKVKNFRCSECEYSCFRKGDLATHVRSIHLKEKAFRCTECEYSCSQKSHLAVHVRLVHLKEKYI